MITGRKLLGKASVVNREGRLSVVNRVTAIGETLSYSRARAATPISLAKDTKIILTLTFSPHHVHDHCHCLLIRVLKEKPSKTNFDQRMRDCERLRQASL